MALLKKIYICGTNLSGKGLLLQLLDGHSNIGALPYHKLGVSGELESFKEFLKSPRYPHSKNQFLANNSYVLNICPNPLEKPYKVSIGDLVYYLLRSNGSVKNLLQAHLTKNSVGFAGDNITATGQFDFSFTDFLDLLLKNFTARNVEILDPEQVDDIIYETYLTSIGQYNMRKARLHFLTYGYNGPEQIRNLIDFYREYKIILVERDPLARLYANTKRVLSLDKCPSNDEIFEVMIRSIDTHRMEFRPLEQVISQYQDHCNLRVIRFEDLVTDTSETMASVASFLGINFESSLTMPSIFGTIIQDRNFFSHRINDDPYRVYTKKRMSKLEKLYYRSNKWTLSAAQFHAKLKKLYGRS